MELTNPRGPASGLVRPASSRAATIRHRQTNTSRQANTETHNVDRQNKRQNTNTDRKTNIYKYNGIIYTIACSPWVLGIAKGKQSAETQKRGTGPFALLVSLASKAAPRPGHCNHSQLYTIAPFLALMVPGRGSS